MSSLEKLKKMIKSEKQLLPETRKVLEDCVASIEKSRETRLEVHTVEEQLRLTLAFKKVADGEPSYVM